MNNKVIDIFAEDALNAYVEFEKHLYEKGPFPTILFRAFFEAAVRYIESTKGSPLIHRNVGNTINGLGDLRQLK